MNVNEVQTLIYGLGWLNRCSDKAHGINQKRLVFKTDNMLITASWINNFGESNTANLNLKLSSIFNPKHSQQPLNEVFNDENLLLKNLMKFVQTVNFSDDDFPYKPSDITEINILGTNGMTLSTYLFSHPIELVGII